MRRAFVVLAFMTAPFIAARAAGGGKTEQRVYDFSPATKVEAAGKEKISFKKVPVDPTRRYVLKFQGRLKGVETIEENPRLGITLHPLGYLLYGILPSLELCFLDKDGKPLKHYARRYTSLPFGKWHLYRHEFYPPLNAAFLKTTIHSGKNTKKLQLKDFSFKERTKFDTININPVVNDSGLYDYSGWRGIPSGGNLIKKADGTVGFHTAYGSFGASFPLKPNTKYVAYGKGKVTGYAATLSVRMFSKTKQVSEVGISREIEFVTPPDCVRGLVFARSMIFEKAFVREAGKNAAKGK